MAWRGWEEYQPPLRAHGDTSTAKSPMIASGTIEKVKDLLRAEAASSTLKRSKYGAQPTEVDGIRFHSKKEAEYYLTLKLREKAGEVRGLALQVPFVLSVGAVSIGKYLADFVYEERIGQDWCHRVKDTKGMDTPLSKWKRRHVKAQYGIEVEIV